MFANQHPAWVDRAISVIAIAGLLPVIVFNGLYSLSTGKRCLRKIPQRDALSRHTARYQWTGPLWANSACLFNLLRQDMSLLGVPVSDALELDLEASEDAMNALPTGFYSPYEAAKRVGMIDTSERQYLNRWAEQLTTLGYLQTLVLLLMAKLFYKTGALKIVERFSLMGVRIDNLSMAQAVDKICSPALQLSQDCSHMRAKIGYFINVNSINLAWDNSALKQDLNASDFNLADGSGVRLGAQKKGIQLLDNNNGTDLLLPLCRRLVEEGKGLYLLGAAPGVAQAAAKNLQEQFPELLITGVHDGYFDESENNKVVKSINRSLTSVVLVAMGSPRQERWIADNSDKLSVDTLLAVGGLFDFYSGKIPRAPEALRTVGFEWLYRLYQEPVTKFKRYVIGNPLYLWRLMMSQ